MADESIAKEAQEFMDRTDASPPTNGKSPLTGRDLDTDDVHEDVDMLLDATGEDVMELFSTDPEYYLDIVQHYKFRKDGSEIYPSDAFNILVERKGPNNNLHVQFKLSRHTQWYQVGYFGDYTDQDVYKAFSEKVHYALLNPMSTRQLIEMTQHSDKSIVEQAHDDVPIKGFRETLENRKPEPEPEPTLAEPTPVPAPQESTVPVPTFEPQVQAPPTTTTMPFNLHKDEIVRVLLLAQGKCASDNVRRHERLTTVVNDYLNNPDSYNGSLVSTLDHVDGNLRALLVNYLLG